MLPAAAASQWGVAVDGLHTEPGYVVDPANQLSAVVMTQFLPFGAHDLDATFRRLVYASLPENNK